MSQTTPPEENASGVTELPAETGADKGVDENEENLLNRLLYRGILPRYAFPTDVATFYVFDANKSTPYRPAYRFSPSQGLPVALSQYAPGKEVWIANKRFFSGAIFSPMSSDRFKAWQDKRLYYECKNCHFACTRPLTSGQRGEVADCPACGKERAFGEARFWFRPPGFAHPVSIPENVSPDEMPPKSYATRAKLDAPTPDAGQGTWTHIGERVRAHYLRKQLLVTNTGPKQDGYTYCTLCGRIEPTSPPTGNLIREHAKPFPDSKKPMCPGNRASNGVCLGTDFISDILLITLRVSPPVRLTPGMLATEIALRTVSEAIAKATCIALELEEGEVQADFRAALTHEGQSGLEAEIYLYDTLPGGAGFSRRAGERLKHILEVAVTILDHCDCDSSCYNCLRSFKNKFEHDRLDRHLGRDLLQYVVNSQPIVLDFSRERRAVALLAEDVMRQAEQSLSLELSASLSVPGIGIVMVPIYVRTSADRGTVVCITHPLTPFVPGTSQLEQMKEYSTIPVVTQSELTVRRSLPSATQAVLAACGIH
jgi:hypothetical protein